MAEIVILSYYSRILAAILHLSPSPSPKWNESQNEYSDRMQIVARSIDTAAHGSRKLASALIVTFWGESRFSPLIHSGEHRGDRGKAICFGQIHKMPGESDATWEAFAGLTLEATTRCAMRSADVMKRSWWYCHGLIPTWGYPEAMVLYGTGRTCRAEETSWKNIFRDRGLKYAMVMERFMK